MNAAELILNQNGSIYHLNLLPEDIASTVILVGDPGRVGMVSCLFDRVEVVKENREFITHTGWYKNQRISVLSTGIGTDNIDIVINELDALVNIDFRTRQPKEKLTSLQLIRIGTSGSIHPEVHVDDFVISGLAVGVDSLGMYYAHQPIDHRLLPNCAYLTNRFPYNLSNFPAPYKEGITLTCSGFYGPQGRILRAPLQFDIQVEELHKTEIAGLAFTNLEMETSGIYLLADILGHKAISINVVLAQRLDGKFSHQYERSVEKLIKATLDWIVSAP